VKNMRFACWMPKARTDTHTQFNSFCFSMAKNDYANVSMLRNTYTYQRGTTFQPRAEWVNGYCTHDSAMYLPYPESLSKHSCARFHELRSCIRMTHLQCAITLTATNHKHIWIAQISTTNSLRHWQESSAMHHNWSQFLFKIQNTRLLQQIKQS
jgi:hypothetical protein